MSFQEIVDSLLEQRGQILMNLNDFTMNKSDYQNEVNRLASVDKQLAFFGL